MQGVVKWFKDTRGYGFVTPWDDSGDCFVHVSQIRTDRTPAGLCEDEEVEFDIVLTPKGRKAVNVHPLNN